MLWICWITFLGGWVLYFPMKLLLWWFSGISQEVKWSLLLIHSGSFNVTWKDFDCQRETKWPYRCPTAVLSQPDCAVLPKGAWADLSRAALPCTSQQRAEFQLFFQMLLSLCWRQKGAKGWKRKADSYQKRNLTLLQKREKTSVPEEYVRWRINLF